VGALEELCALLGCAEGELVERVSRLVAENREIAVMLEDGARQLLEGAAMVEMGVELHRAICAHLGLPDGTTGAEALAALGRLRARHVS
jgi:hypothetical protein